MMKREDEKKRDWVDIAAKTLIPGLMIAWVGIVGNLVLSSISNKQESARLITELQIKREQAESELRKDVFNQALEAFLLKKTDSDGSLKSMSKQLLRLELLALNFGDSLSLSPLFAELRTDLNQSKPINDKEKRDYKERKAGLEKRLNSLAKRVASAQLSSLAQHGDTQKIDIPLYEYKYLSESNRDPCNVLLFEEVDYAWPDLEIFQMMGLLNSDYQPVDNKESLDGLRLSAIYKQLTSERGALKLQHVTRNLSLYVSDVDHCRKTAKVQIIITKDGQDEPEVDRTFTLDYFNFPMVDNTRLSDNHRFAVVMEEFITKGDRPHIEVTAIVFPAEYSSLRDRPGMQEARELLESAMEND